MIGLGAVRRSELSFTDLSNDSLFARSTMFPFLPIEQTSKVKIFEMPKQIDAVCGMLRSRHKTEEVLSARVSSLVLSSFSCSFSHYDLLENTGNEETETSPLFSPFSWPITHYDWLDTVKLRRGIGECQVVCFRG